jgi:ubiquinone/menaquinone biosynthesis C-methylase UbiE
MKDAFGRTMLDYVAEHFPETKLETRHDKTQLATKNGIADLIGKYAKGSEWLLEIGAFTGWQTLAYRNRMNPEGSAEIYDWQDFCAPSLRQHIGFHQVDLETDAFPAGNESFDVIVVNQVLEHLKNIFLPLSEICRVLKIGGHLVVSVPNICALHNLFLLMLGRQPTTMAIEGGHVREYAIWSMSQFLQRNGHLATIELRGYGLHPLTSAPLPGFLRTYCHTPVWLMARQRSVLPTWQDLIQRTFTTTNF